MALLVALGLAAGPVLAAGPALHLGPFDIFASANAGVEYSDNYDGAYPEEVDHSEHKDDFTFTAGLAANTGLAVRENVRFALGGSIGYEKYLYHDADDTMTYSGIADMTVRLPPFLALHGMAGADYSIEEMEISEAEAEAEGGETETEYEYDATTGTIRKKTYRKGHSHLRHDPCLTLTYGADATFEVGNFTANAGATFTSEAYDKKESQEGDNDEWDYTAGVHYDLTSFLGLYYTYERTETTYPHQTNSVREIENTHEFGVDGSLPWIRHPVITWSVGIESSNDEPAEREYSWEPTYSIGASDSFQIMPNLLFAGSLTWEREVDEDDISFEYDLSLTHTWGRLTHALNFTQEPESTFGSNQDTKDTTFAYTIGVSDVFIKGLSLSASFQYEIEEPLGDDSSASADEEESALSGDGADGEEGSGDAGSGIEYTRTIDASVSHSRQLTLSLSRTLSYTYSYELSNFHHHGPQQEHVVSYSLNYVF
ncbi:MAG: hypothetical protein IJS32_02980 [Kiritimatiellae bacterium]|nr:hypothetical protein [Kiritimatiellia bacterium]